MALLVTALASVLGQQQQETVGNVPNTAGDPMKEPAQSAPASPAMDRMAESMTSMADMCRMMMEKEMKKAPLKFGALITLGSLFALALVLFIVLEIQWIRFWHVRRKTEQLKLDQQKVL